MQEKTKEWKIPVCWEVFSTVNVRAATLEEALRYVREDPDDMPLPTDTDYIDGSFGPSMDDVEEIRQLYNGGQSDQPVTGRKEIKYGEQGKNH